MEGKLSAAHPYTNRLISTRIDWYFLFFLQVRVSQEQEHFLLNPFGLLYSEVTGSSLIKVDMQASDRSNLIEPGIGWIHENRM